MPKVIGHPTRRVVLGAAAALIPLARARATTTPGLLAPASYGDPAFLKLLGGKGPSWSLTPLPSDDRAAAMIAAGPEPALAVITYPWMSGVLWPEGLIAPLPDTVPHLAGSGLGETFPSVATVERSLDGGDRLGVATRFDLAGTLIRTDRVPRDTVDEMGLAILDDPALDGRIALFDDGRCLLASLMLYAGLDPFRLQLQSERTRFAILIESLMSRVVLVSRDSKTVLSALADGKADLALPMGLRHQAAARLTGYGKVSLALPKTGPLAGRGAFGWIETASMPATGAAVAIAAQALGRLIEPAVRLALVRAGGGLQPVVGLDGLRDQLSALEIAALGLDEWPSLVRHAAPMALIPEHRTLRAALDQILDRRPRG